MSATVKALTTATFSEEIAASSLPVLVDFWAEWCGPCKRLAPVLDEVASEHSDRFTIAKVNVDEHPSLAQQFGVMSIPTLILFSDGLPVGEFRGAMDKASLLAKVDPVLA